MFDVVKDREGVVLFERDDQLDRPGKWDGDRNGLGCQCRVMG